MSDNTARKPKQPSAADRAAARRVAKQSAHHLTAKMGWDAMSIDKTVEKFRKEFPYWRWNGGYCHVSAHATIAPDEGISDELRAFDERFNSGFDADLYHASGVVWSVADALEAAMKEARAACDAWQAHSGKDARG